jgi:hypothetical protein
MKTKLLEMYHYTELIAPIDEQINRFEKENLTYSVKKVITLGTIDIGQVNYISYFLIIYRFSLRKTIKNLPKILGIYWKKK